MPAPHHGGRFGIAYPPAEFPKPLKGINHLQRRRSYIYVRGRGCSEDGGSSHSHILAVKLIRCAVNTRRLTAFFQLSYINMLRES